MIQSIQLQNWRSHKDSTLAFKKGTNVLVGVMGSGKSSIVDAICFGLFGTFPALHGRRVSLEETIMQKPISCDSARIRLGFQYNNKNFVVERSIFKGNKTSEAKLYCDDRLIAGPKPGEVTQRIEQELEVTFGLFSRAVYSEQNQIDFFLRLSPRERKQKFDELLEINRYETTRQNAVSVGNRLKKTSEDKKKWVIEQEKHYKHEDLEKIKKDTATKKEQHQEWSKKAKILQEKNRERAVQIQELEKAEQKLKQIREREIQTATKIESLGKNIQNAQKNLENQSSIQLQEKLQFLFEKEKNTLKEKKTLSSQQEQTTTGVNTSEQELQILTVKIRELQKNQQEIGRVEGKCPFCRRSLGAHEKQELEQEIKEQEQKISQEIQAKKSNQQQLKESQEQLGKILEENQKNLEKTREEKLQTEFVLKQTGAIEEQQKSLEQEKTNLAECKNQKETIAFDEPKLSNLRKELLEEKSQEIKAIEEAQKNLELAKQLETQAKQLEQIQTQLLTLRQETNQLEKVTEKLGLFTVSLQTVQATLREQLLDAINQAMNSIWQKAYPYSDFETTQIIVENGDYEVKVKTRRGEWIRVEGNLSGGER
ncbi:SMC family ATPase, partial [Candidatus Micrarchaeota archaeon]|nr:SMC family ATPase [Candidatus Micrarchaeota archaeon]MBU1930380.1 SMC family ATPase [Candidatus Micrarchaeota archaeon]